MKLKQLKENHGMMVNPPVNYGQFLCNIHTKINKVDHRALLRKIEKSRFIYKRKEPIIIALKKAFILANKLEDTLDSAKKFKLKRKILIQAYMEEYRKVSKYSIKKLDHFIVDKTRLKRINACKWSVETIDVKDLGVWPSFGGIDQFTTCGNLLDTKEKIIDLIKNTHKFKWPIKPNLPDKSLSRLALEEKYADFIFRFYPIIVTAKGPDTRRVQAGRLAKKQLGFGYKITPYDIEDGNHRATAFALFGIRKIKCFVGRGLVTDTP